MKLPKESLSEKWFNVDCRWVVEGTYLIGCENEQRAAELALKALEVPNSGQPISETFEVINVRETTEPDASWGEKNA